MLNTNYAWCGLLFEVFPNLETAKEDMLAMTTSRAVARRFKQGGGGGVSVKFADKPCSERMAIVHSCQVQMIKNLEVVGAFSAKSVSVPFSGSKIFSDIPKFFET